MQKGATFYNMEAALLLSDQKKNQVYKNVILGGGENVSEINSIEGLLEQPLILKNITHIFIDPWIIQTENPRNSIFKTLRSEIQKEKINIHILYYRYLFLKCRQNPTPVESQFSIFQPKIQELWEKDYKIFQAQQKVQQQQAKRPLAVSENGKSNKKIRQSAMPTLVPKEVELVTLHSSENEYKNDTDTSLCDIDDSDVKNKV